LLATPATVTTTLPVVAPLGTLATMLPALQLVIEAVSPLKSTVLVPWLLPKFEPVMVTDVPTAPELGERLVIVGNEVPSVTVKITQLLPTPPTAIVTQPVVAPLGTGTTMLVLLQLDGVAAIPLNVTVLLPCVATKFEPLIVTIVPIGPELGERTPINGCTVVDSYSSALFVAW
jgi:hypothetical protein